MAAVEAGEVILLSFTLFHFSLDAVVVSRAGCVLATTPLGLWVRMYAAWIKTQGVIIVTVKPKEAVTSIGDDTNRIEHARAQLRVKSVWISYRDRIATYITVETRQASLEPERILSSPAPDCRVVVSCAESRQAGVEIPATASEAE